MNTYQWRKNFTALFIDQEKTVRGKLAFKTKETDWLETEEPVVVFVSVHSSFHDQIGGDLKMNAFISTIKEHVRGRVTVLLTDHAHLQTLILSYAGDAKRAFQECLHVVQSHIRRYQPYFAGCHVAFWHSYICQDEHYLDSVRYVQSLYANDSRFRDLIHADSESTYTNERAQCIVDKKLFIEKSVEDLLEQCTCQVVLAKKGYRFQFYPGDSFASVEYINRSLNSLSWISVFLSIEKKTFIK